MNRSILNSLSLVTALISTNILASESKEGFYLGADFGNATVDSQYISDISLSGFHIGYDFGDNYSIELEKMSGDSNLKNGLTGKAEIDTTAIFGVWRFGQELFFNTKLGFLSEKVTVTTSSSQATATDSGLSYGFGAGYRTESLMLEAEYTNIETDVSSITFSLSYIF